MSDVNLSAVLKSINDLKLEDRSIPEPGPGQVLIAVHSVGICGSDVHYLVNGRIGNFIVNEPMLLGHESSGTVAKLGRGVTTLKIGDRVALEPGIPCHRCDQCRIGRYNLCPEMRFLATPPVHGDLCRFHVHEANFCFKLPDHVTFEEGALLEPLSVGVHACRRAGVTLGTTVLICGAGPIGLVNLLTARAMGAEKVLITDLVEGRLKVAQEMGADWTLCLKPGDSESDIVKQIIDIIGYQPEVTIECTGAESCIRTAIGATKSGGCVVLVGLGRPEVNLPIVDAAVREVDIRGVFRYVNCYPAALSLVSQGKVDVKKLITHRFALEETLEAFNTAKSPETGAIKVIIKCAKE